MGAKLIRGRFAIPSGIRCVKASVIERCFSSVDPLGVITTKSISVLPRQGYREPIYARYSFGSYINAVGLANPGAEVACRELQEITVPNDKFLLVSVFGGNAKEFVTAADVLRPVADGFELNMSCPHAAGYGIEIGQDMDMVAAITHEVVQAMQVPVFVKLSATIPQIGRTAAAAIDAGALGITVTNTLGPSVVDIGDVPILSNKVGGLSGNGIRPLALRAVQVIRTAIGPTPIIIGMGGIGTPEHIVQFRNAGADVFGVGSAVTGLDTHRFGEYFADLEKRSASDSPYGSVGTDSADTAVTMQYHQCQVVGTRHYNDRLYELTLDRLPEAPKSGDLSGRYYFLCVPGVGEKPFAVFSSEKRSIVIKSVGCLTSHLAGVASGSRLLLRGPYGRHFRGVEGASRYVLVGGGTGIASLLEVGYVLRRSATVEFVLGAATKAELFGLQEFESLGPVAIATDDGTAGFHGNAADLLTQYVGAGKLKSESVFVNCGPEPMIAACADIERRVASDDRIVAAVEYPTSCGVGICGKCASPSGYLTCIDGPFMPLRSFEARPFHRSQPMLRSS
ncbi:MAG: tRNA-dihydrouridine synthase [Bryobacteraceae bacterium]